MYQDDEAPFMVNDYELDDLSGQTGGDVIDAAQGVRMSVHKKTCVRLSKDKGVIKLNLGGVIGPLGTDANGKYAGKVMWYELIAGFTVEGKESGKYASDWWQKTARFPFKTFIKAMGFDEKTPPRLNDEFLQNIAGKEFVCNILKKEIRMKGEDGVYAGTGEMRNELSGIKRAE